MNTTKKPKDHSTEKNSRTAEHLIWDMVYQLDPFFKKIFGEGIYTPVLDTRCRVADP